MAVLRKPKFGCIWGE